MTEQVIRYGFVSDQQTVLGLLNTMSRDHLGWLLALIVGVYVLRRLVDAGLRVGPIAPLFALLAILIESFFLLLLIMGGIRVFQIVPALARRSGDRSVVGCGRPDAISRFFAIFAIDLPAVVTHRAGLHRRPGLAGLLGGAQSADHLAGRCRPGLRFPGAVAGRAVASGRPVARLRARSDPVRRVPGEDRPPPAPDRRRGASSWPPPRSGRPSSATSTTSTCRPSIRSGWCCGPDAAEKLMQMTERDIQNDLVGLVNKLQNEARENAEEQAGADYY